MAQISPLSTPTIELVRARLADTVSEKTLAHAERTANVARVLANHHGLDADRAELAGLVHDVADPLSERELIARAERYGIPVTLTEARVPRLLHAPVGAEILRTEWGIGDEEVLDAVRYHVTGAPVMSSLVKVVFIADKIEPARDQYYPGLEAVRAIALTSLDQAALRLYGWRVNELVDSGQPVHERMAAARNTLIEQTLAMQR